MSKAPYVGTLTWSWDFKHHKDMGWSTQAIFDYNYPIKAPRAEIVAEAVKYAIKKDKEFIRKQRKATAKKTPKGKGSELQNLLRVIRQARTDGYRLTGTNENTARKSSKTKRNTNQKRNKK